MLISWCLAIVLLQNVVHSSNICSKNKEDRLLTFVDQPLSVCLPGISTYSVRCAGLKTGSKDSGAESTSLVVEWTVLSVGDGGNEKSVPFEAVKNGSQSIAILKCDKTKDFGCSFKVWCTVRLNNTDGGDTIINQQKTIRSRSALVDIGNINRCNNTSDSPIALYARQQPEPRHRVIKAAPLSNVTLPCLVFLPHSTGEIIPTSWFYNGRRLFSRRSSLGSFFEADGVFNIERRRKDDFFLWSNLTIFHVQPHHAGYYQCFVGEENFNLILLAVAANNDNKNSHISPDDTRPSDNGVANSYKASLSVPVISRLDYMNDKATIYFINSKISFYDGDGTITVDNNDDDNIKYNSLKNNTSLIYYVGIIRQRNYVESSANAAGYHFVDCHRGSIPGATTSFSQVRVATDTEKEAMVDLSLPEDFFLDHLICRQFYSYAVFVKFVSPTYGVAVVSLVRAVSYENFESFYSYRQQLLPVTVDERKSGIHYACLNFGPKLTAADNHRIVPQTHLESSRTVVLEPFCQCEHRALLNTSSLTSSISLSNVPFTTGGLIPDASYCFIVADKECIDYYVPGSQNDLQHPMTYERLGKDIAVSWHLAACRSMKKDSSLTTKLSHQDSVYSIESPSGECSDRVVFKEVENYTQRHEATLHIDQHPLYTLAIPAELTVRNFSALAISRSRIILSWTVVGFLDDLAENQRVVEMGFTIYGCLPSIVLPSSGVMDKKTLLCLGCQQLCRVPINSQVPDVVYADVFDHDKSATEFKFVLWADASLTFESGEGSGENLDGVFETVPIGIVSTTNFSIVDSEIDAHRPYKVAVISNASHTEFGYYADWNISWMPPVSTLPGLSLVSYTVVVTPVLHYLHFDTDEGMLAKVVPASHRSLTITNLTHELLISESIGASRLCPRVPTDVYIVQVFPIWAWEHDESNNSFIVDGASSAPYVYRGDYDDALTHFDRLHERALADAISIPPDSRISATEAQQKPVLLGIPSSLLPVPIVIVCLSLLCALFVGMFFVYRYQVRRNRIKHKPERNGLPVQGIRSFTSRAPPVSATDESAVTPPLLSSATLAEA